MAKKMKYVENHCSELEEIFINLQDECIKAKEILDSLIEKQKTLGVQEKTKETLETLIDIDKMPEIQEKAKKILAPLIEKEKSLKVQEQAKKTLQALIDIEDVFEGWEKAKKNLEALIAIEKTPEVQKKTEKILEELGKIKKGVKYLQEVWNAVYEIINLAISKERVEVSPIQQLENLYFYPEKVKLLFTAQMDQKQIGENVVYAVRKLFCPYDYLGNGNERYHINMDLIISVLFEIFENEKISSKKQCEYSYNVIWGEDIIETKGYTVTQYTLKEKKSDNKVKGEAWFDKDITKSEVYKPQNDKYGKMGDFLAGKCTKYFSFFYQIGIKQLYKVVEKLMTKGSYRDKSFARYFNSYQSFCSLLPFSEIYMIEKFTGLYLAVELYMYSQHLMNFRDEDLITEMGKVAKVISEIECLEVRLYVAKGICNILGQTKDWEKQQIINLLETITEEIKKNKDFFNIYYHRAIHILLYAFKEKKYWENIKILIAVMERHNKTDNQFSYNILRSYVSGISQGGSNQNNNFQNLYLAWDARKIEYHFFDIIFSGIKKGEAMLYQNTKKDSAKEQEIWLNLFASEKSCPDGFKLIEW